MLANAKEVLAKALENGYAVGSFNFSTIEILNGIADAAAGLSSPVFLSTSEREADHFRLENASSVVLGLCRRLRIPLVLHLDHGKSFEMCRAAIECGYNSVHIDGSLLPYSVNKELTKRVADYAHSKGVSVEAELGHIGGHSEFHSERIKHDIEMTDPEQAADFVKSTGCDSLAIAVGNMHGMYTDEPIIDTERVKRIMALVAVPLVLHGGSGIPEKAVKDAIAAGIAKVNVNTENRLAYANAVKHVLAHRPEESTPYVINSDCTGSVCSVTKSKIMLFGSAGRA